MDVWVIVVATAIVGLALAFNWWWNKRPVRALKAFRAEHPLSSHMWLGNMADAGDIELFSVEGEDLKLLRPAKTIVEANNGGLRFDYQGTYKSGREVRPVTIPWNKIHDAGLTVDQPSRSGPLGAPAPTRIAIAVSEQWLEQLGGANHPGAAVLTPERQAEIDRLKADYDENKDEYDEEYDDDMREDFGDLYERGLDFVCFESLDVEGLVEAIKMRATGVPEPLADDE